MFNSGNQKRLLEENKVFFFFQFLYESFLLFCSQCLSAKAILVVKLRSVSSV